MESIFNEKQALGLLSAPSSELLRHTRQALSGFSRASRLFSRDALSSPLSSSVLFLMGRVPDDRSFAREPCLIFTKRSSKVKQPGDLCFPGGSISQKADPFFAGLLYLPGSPLTRWPDWPEWRRRPEAKTLARLLATGLREGFEEMRLNPLGVDFLGPLPPEHLVTFRRKIYPMACWVEGQKRFHPNREVEKIVRIPLKEMIRPEKYACLRLVTDAANHPRGPGIRNLPCFLHERAEVTERLWGATYRMTMVFLERVFGFRPPELETLPTVSDRLGENYLTGSP